MIFGGKTVLNLKENLKKITKTHLQIIGVLLLVALAILLLWFGNYTSTQSTPALVPGIRFEGRYRIGEGDWQPIVDGEHIPSTEGDVTLSGNFRMFIIDPEESDPEEIDIGLYRGELPIAFYLNHIQLTIYENGVEPTYLDLENPIYGKSVCGVNWDAHLFVSDAEDTIEILVHNPHSYGNDTAIDEMLSSLALWSGVDFENGVLNSGEPQRNIGMILMLVSIVLLGIALFSSLIHIKNNLILWLIGAVVLFAGSYVTYSADGVSFWSDSIVSNTTILGFSMMFYMLFLSIIITFALKSKKRIGNITVIVLGVVNAAIFVLSMATELLFYDTWVWWAAAQLISNAVLAVCLILDFRSANKKERLLYIALILPLIAFAVDAFGIGIGAWSDGLISRYVFVTLFAVAMIMVLKFIPSNINAATKARELEMERIVLNAQLAESRISTMMSQIRPHFIYNTLGSIEQLCRLDPPKAAELVHNFAKYLRGNFGELDNPKPILMSQEMEHVHHYVSIENVRFPDMTFTFEMNSGDFKIPALTVQPIVENAIKHGLMKLQNGGTIHVISYETDTHYFVSVEDDGVGFDASAVLDSRKHLGIRNIRERLKVMVNGSLEISSTPGVGTKVTIQIPKED